MSQQLEAYKARWADFAIECENLDHARRALAHGYANEDLESEWDELCDRVDVFEARIANLAVWRRADEILAEAYRYDDI